MDLRERCLNCPLPWRDALILVGVSLALLLFGRVLLEIPRRILRGFGLLGLGASLILHAFGLSAVALVGVGWGAISHGRWSDLLFAVGWLLLSSASLVIAGRIGRAFPRRSPRLHAVGFAHER